MVFPERIVEIANLIEPNSCVADVGADHGKLELFLVANKDIKSIVAIENKIGPYNILKENLIGLKKVRTSLSDGLTAVDKNVDCIVIAGMGGQNIKNILNKHPDHAKQAKTIIIDAHRDIELARRSIVGLGFEFVCEKLVFEANKFYVISKFKNVGKTPKYKKDIYQIGFELQKDKLWPEFQEHLIETNLKTIEKIKTGNGSRKDIRRLKKLNKRLLRYGKN